MNRRAAAIVLVAVLTGVLFASVATSGGVNLWSEPQWEPRFVEPTPRESEASESESEPLVAAESSDRQPLEIPRWVAAIVQGILVATAIILAIYGIRAAWQRRPRLRWRRRDLEDFEALPDVASAVIEEAGEHRRLLQGGTPRNAIVQCWLRLEADVVAAGLQRNSSDTSAEFTERVLQHYAVDTGAIQRLSSLYREARFSDHPIDETARAEALRALDRLHRSLADSLKRPVELDAGVTA